MDKQLSKEKPAFRWLTKLAGGYLLILYLAFFTIVILYYSSQGNLKNSPKSAPVNTPTPHLLIRLPSNNIDVQYDDFTSNKRAWSLNYPHGKLEVINGKLILQSDIQGRLVIGINQKFIPSGGKYYIQADLVTDIDTAHPYGLVFGLNESLGTYYLFEIYPRRESFKLLKYSAGTWDELISSYQSKMNPFPEANTLSVQFNNGSMELFINGESVSIYTDKVPFISTGIGVFVSNFDFRLIVDNFYAYSEE